MLKPDDLEYLWLFAVPLLYLGVMFFATKAAAKNRARRFAELVIKEDLIKAQKKPIQIKVKKQRKIRRKCKEEFKWLNVFVLSVKQN